MRVVADSHALVRYLVDPQRLSDAAADALLAAEDTDGVIVSVATLGDLWYASQKTSGSLLPPGVYELVRDAVLDPGINLQPHPISTATMEHFNTIPLADLRDPFDRFIVATAAQLEAPLVTADRAVTAAGLVATVW